MNTLLVAAPDSVTTKKLCSQENLKVKFIINSLKDYHQDLDIEQIVKDNIDEKYSFDFSEEDQKRYQNFLKKILIFFFSIYEKRIKNIRCIRNKKPFCQLLLYL